MNAFSFDRFCKDKTLCQLVDQFQDIPYNWRFMSSPLFSTWGEKCKGFVHICL